MQQPIDVILSANSPRANTSRHAESLLDHSGGDFLCQIARPIGKFVRLPHKQRLVYAYSGKRNMLTKVSALVLAAMLITVAVVPGASAGPALLIDAADDTVLYAEDPDLQWHPASLTKMMTAYVTFVAIKEGTLAPEASISCSALANSQGPTKVGLAIGATIKVEIALQALVVKSANDVAVMLAEAVAGSHEAFVERMNATAARLGMTRTHFANANGLPAPEQVTTARDMAKLASAVVRDYPQYAHIWSALDVQVGKRRLHSHNGLLVNYEGADGMKTGFICDSGFNVVASATRQGRKMIAVVLGEATAGERSVRAANLLQHGFQTYKWKGLFSPPTLATLPVAEDERAEVTKPRRVISHVCGTGGRGVVKSRTQKARAVANRAAHGRQKRP
jgi:D-alanyl-D-alanine carboxypeptidase